MEKEVH